MHRRILVPAAALCAAVLVVSAFSCGGCEKSRAPVTGLIAREAANAVVMPSPEQTLGRLHRFLGKFEGSSVGEQAKVEVQGLSKRFGFNPFDPAGWRKAGLDPARGLAVTLETVKRDGKDVDAALFIVGVGDAGAFDKTVKRLAREQERAELYRDQSYKQGKITTILRQGPSGEKPVFVFAVYEGFGIFSDPANGPDAIRKLVDRRLQNGLDQSPVYARLRAKIRPDADLHLFVNEGSSFDKVPMLNRRALELFKVVQEHFKGMVAGLGLDGGVSLEVFIGLSDTAAQSAVSYMTGQPRASAAMLKTVSDDALLVAKGSVDLAKLFAKMKKDAPAETFQLNKAIFGWVQKFCEVDPEEKIIPALSGDIAYAVYPGNLELIGDVIQQGMRGGAPYKLVNLAYAVGLRDPARGQAFLLEFEDGLKAHGVPVADRQVNAQRFKTAQIGGGFESAWTFREKLFIGAYGPGRIERAVGLAGGAPGALLEKVSSDRMKDLLLSDSAEVIYLSFANIGKAISSIKKESLGQGSGTLFIQSFLDLVKDVLARLSDGVVGVRAAPDGLRVEAAINLK